MKEVDRFTYINDVVNRILQVPQINETMTDEDFDLRNKIIVIIELFIQELKADPDYLDVIEKIKPIGE